MSFIRLLMGRRKFLVGSATSALGLTFGRISGLFGQQAPAADAAKALDKTKPIVNKKLKGVVVYYTGCGNTGQYFRGFIPHHHFSRGIDRIHRIRHKVDNVLQGPLRIE